MSYERWTEHEDAILKANYEKLGAEKTAELLPSRNPTSVARRARLIGKAKKYAVSELGKGHARWTEEEDALVRDNYAELGPTATAKLVPNRTHAAVMARAKILGVRGEENPYWTEEEDAVLREYAGKEVLNDLAARLPNRTKAAVAFRVKKLGLEPLILHPRWTEAEDRELRASFRKDRAGAIAKRVGRTKSEVYRRARELGLSDRKSVSWTEEEKRLILDNYASKGLRWCAGRLEGRTANSVAAMANRLGVSNKKKENSPRKRSEREYEAWTDGELEILKARYRAVGPKKLAEELPGRSVYAITNKRRCMDIDAAKEGEAS